MKRIKLTGERQREHALQCVRKAVLGQCVTIADETRSQEQNRLMWPLIKDMQDQIPGMDEFTPDDVKLRCMNSLKQEARYLPELDGPGLFMVGKRSSLLSKPQFSALLEIIFVYGARHNVRWSAKSLNVFGKERN